MRDQARSVTVGRVGKPHGLDGSFTVRDPGEPVAVGDTVTVAGLLRRVERVAGTREHPILRLEGVRARDAAERLRGELVLTEVELGGGEWVAEDLVGCSVTGLGTVTRVLAGRSCDLLELDDGRLVPLVGDAVKAVDLAAGRIDVDPAFLGVDGP